jgi:hypothetical protein
VLSEDPTVESVFSVERVQAAYKGTGLRPKPGVYLDGKCACAAGAVTCAKFPDLLRADREWGALTVANCFGLGLNEVMAFAAGFDDRDAGWAESRLRRAFEHGRMVAREVLSEVSRGG